MAPTIMPQGGMFDPATLAQSMVNGVTNQVPGYHNPGTNHPLDFRQLHKFLPHQTVNLPEEEKVVTMPNGEWRHEVVTKRKSVDITNIYDYNVAWACFRREYLKVFPHFSSALQVHNDNFNEMVRECGTFMFHFAYEFDIKMRDAIYRNMLPWDYTLDPYHYFIVQRLQMMHFLEHNRQHSNSKYDNKSNNNSNYNNKKNKTIMGDSPAGDGTQMPLCHLYQEGKCNRQQCRFSHQNKCSNCGECGHLKKDCPKFSN